MAQLLAAEVREDASGPTKGCPDDITLAAYAEFVLLPEKSGRVGEHVARCQHYIDLLRLRNGDEPATVEQILAQADREIDVEILAREIAAWLVRNHYPEEEAAVDGLLEVTRDRDSKTSRPQGESAVFAELHFVSSGRSRTVQIVEPSRFAGSLLELAGDEAPLADEFAGHAQRLKAVGFSEILISRVLQYLRDE